MIDRGSEIAGFKSCHPDEIAKENFETSRPLATYRSPSVALEVRQTAA
jgi:hypothetical protein